MRISAVRSAALAAALVLSAAPLQAQTEAPDRRPTLFVVEFRNGAIGRAADFEPLTKGIPDLLVSELAANPGVRVVDRDNLNAILREQDMSTTGRIDDATAVKVGKILGAHHYIKGSFVVDPRGRLRLDAHAVNTETSRVEHVESVTGNADDVLDLIASLSEKLNKGLKLPQLPPAEARPVTPPPSSSGTAATEVASTTSPATPAATNASSTQGATASTGRPTNTAPARTVARAPKKENNFQAVMLYSRALAEEDKGNVQGAVELYRKSLAIFPEYTTAKQRLARLEKRGA
jgi:TolB-like protein